MQIFNHASILNECYHVDVPIRQAPDYVILACHAVKLPPPSHNADVTISCSVGPSAIRSFTILKIGGNRKPL